MVLTAVKPCFPPLFPGTWSCWERHAIALLEGTVLPADVRNGEKQHRVDRCYLRVTRAAPFLFFPPSSFPFSTQKRERDKCECIVGSGLIFSSYVTVVVRLIKNGKRVWLLEEGRRVGQVCFKRATVVVYICGTMRG